MDSLIYAGFVLAGAMTLMIEAYRNFNAPGSAHPFALHPILKTVEIRNLTTPAEAMIGFAIYAACYLIVYAVVLGSAEILQLVLDANRSRTEVGAIGTALQGDGDALALTGSGYEKPLLVSAALIAFVSLGAVRPIEQTLRGVAHSLAGIPGGVYKVITELQNFDFIDHSRGYPTPLTTRFINNARTMLTDDNEYASLRAEIARSLSAIDCLTEATSPTRSRLYFPLFQLATLTELSKTLDDQVAELDAAIEAMPERMEREPPAAILQSVAQMTQAARQNTMAVFAVLYVRNNRSVFVSSRPFRRVAAGPDEAQSAGASVAPIEAVRRAIALRYNAELNSFTIALVLASLVGAAAIFWTYNSWYERNAYGPTPRSELSWAVCADARSTYEQALAMSDARLRDAGWSDQQLAARSLIRCSDTDQRVTRPDQVAAFLLELRPTMASLTFFDTLRSTVLILTCVFFVLIGRESRIDDQSWPKNWSFRQFPFLTLLGMSFFPGLIGIVSVASTALAEQTYYTGGQIRSSQVTDLFLNNWGYFAMQFGSGLILAFGALVVMDKHDSARWRWFVTMGVGLVFAVIVSGWSWCVTYFTNAADPSFFLVAPEQPVSRHLRDTLIFGAVPALFFVIFALFLELSEQGARHARAEGSA